MVEKMVRVGSDLEARPAALFVQLAGKFEAKTKIALGNKHSNCKSIMGMISLGIVSGSEVVLYAEGADEEAAIEELGLFLGAQRH